MFVLVPKPRLSGGFVEFTLAHSTTCLRRDMAFAPTVSDPVGLLKLALLEIVTLKLELNHPSRD